MASLTGLPSAHLLPDAVVQLSWAVDALSGKSIAALEEPGIEAKVYSLYCHALPAAHWDSPADFHDEQLLDRSAAMTVVATGLFGLQADIEKAIRHVCETIQTRLDEANKTAILNLRNKGGEDHG